MEQNRYITVQRPIQNLAKQDWVMSSIKTYRRVQKFTHPTLIRYSSEGHRKLRSRLTLLQYSIAGTTLVYLTLPDIYFRFFSWQTNKQASRSSSNALCLVIKSHQHVHGTVVHGACALYQVFFYLSAHQCNMLLCLYAYMHNDNVLSSEVVIVQLRKSMHINAIQKKQIHIIKCF